MLDGLALGDRVDPAVHARPAAHPQRPHGPDHPAGDGTSKDTPWNTPAARPGHHPCRHPSLSPRTRSDRPPPAHRWIEVKWDGPSGDAFARLLQERLGGVPGLEVNVSPFVQSPPRRFWWTWTGREEECSAKCTIQCTAFE